MPARRSRLPPAHVMALLFVAALLIAAARPQQPPKTTCCAVKQATFHPSTRTWRVMLAHNGTNTRTTTKQVRAPAPVVHVRGNLPNLIRSCCMRGWCVPAAVPCEMHLAHQRSSEDPTDALWLRAYNQGSELVVLLRMGALAALLVVLAVLVDGALPRPRRAGWARAPATALALLATSVLLILVLVPRKWQFQAWGGGVIQSVLWMSSVISFAVVMPGLFLIVRALIRCTLHAAILTVKALFWTIVGAVEFAIALTKFYTENLKHDCQALYAADEIHPDDTYMNQLTAAHKLLTAVSFNPLLRKVPTTINSAAKKVLLETIATANDPSLFDDEDPENQHDDNDIGSDEYREITQAAVLDFRRNSSDRSAPSQNTLSSSLEHTPLLP